MSASEFKLPPTHLTVLLRDDSPMIYCGDSPSYRRVTVALTQEQRVELALRQTHTDSGKAFYEDVSRLLLEDA